MMKKVSFIIIIITLLALSFSSCSVVNYGTAYKSQEELKEELQKIQIELKYPQFFPNQDNKKVKFNYISNHDKDKNKDVGYKIYCFSEPFNTAMYGYDYESNDVKSDAVEQLTKSDIISASGIEIQLYEGTGHEDSLFIIGIANIGGKHYECRIVGNKTTIDGEPVNYIYKDNENYIKALMHLKAMFENLT